MKKNYTSFRCQEGSWIQIHKIISDTALIMLERTMHLPFSYNIVVSEEYLDFKITDLMVSIMLKYGQ